MPQIDFYIIADDSPQGHFHYVCRLIEKIYALGHKVFINCSHIDDVHLLDELLWTFKDESFIPHNIIGEGPTPPPPIQLGDNKEPQGFNDVLINFSDTIPAFHHRFKRVIEIVTQYPPIKQLSREHYKFYRDKGYALKTHDLTGNPARGVQEQ